MVLLCFLLDLRTLSPPLLKDFKQCLLQLANYYAISTAKGGDKQSEILTDRIGLCYLHKNRISKSSDELKIAYIPRGNFSLRDFHHAVNNLPTDEFLPEVINSSVTRIGGGDVILEKLLSEDVLFSWGGKDIVKKVIFISSCLVEGIDSARKSLIDAADKCVSVEFVLFEQQLGQTNSMSADVQTFINNISDLENCSLRTHLPDTWVMCGLVKRWHQELKDDIEEPLQAVFHFKNHLVGSTNRIFCNLIASVNHILDGFNPCQACRCHGLPLDGSAGTKTKRSSFCPITCQELGTCNLIETALRVGEQTILFLPSFESCPNLKPISGPISFTVIERTDLGSLSEGVILGNSYMVTPSAFHEMETTSDESELNTQLFQGLCGALHSLDQGLICTSNCNLETKRNATFHCFYILQPSDKGPMLLRRLAGSEEILPLPDATGSIDFAVPNEIQNSIKTSLSNMALRDYNPLLHERGFHPKLNMLVKESLMFGSIPPPPPKRKEMNSEVFYSPRPESSSSSDTNTTPVVASTLMMTVDVEEYTEPTQVMREDNKMVACITEEWEQLIVDEAGKIYPPTFISRPKTKTNTKTPLSILSQVDANNNNNNNKQLDEKTSRILERLEAPRLQAKTKVNSPTTVKCNAGTDAFAPKKKPLVPFPLNHATDSQGGASSSQPLKPNFQRLKRKKQVM